jgi:hypothetical protein
MTKFELWLIKKVFKRVLNPGRGYAGKEMHTIFSVMYDQLQFAFSEDNYWDTSSHMKEILIDVTSQKSPK